MDLSNYKGMDLSNPSDLADLLFKRVVFYCRHVSYDTPLDCMVHHNPNAFFVFANSFLNKEEAKKLEKTIENPSTFWGEVEKEYKNLWDKWWPEELAWDLGHLIIEDLAYNIANKYELDNTSKVERLKAYAEVLHEFADAIKLALQEQKPLSSEQLYEWYKRMYEVASSFGFDKWARKAIEYYLRFYDMYKKYKLPTLSLLLEYVNKTLHKIENEYLPELEGLTNKI